MKEIYKCLYFDFKVIFDFNYYPFCLILEDKRELIHLSKTLVSYRKDKVV